LRDSKLAAWRSASGDTKTTKKNNKPRVDYEPRSAHGRAVKNKSKTIQWKKLRNFDVIEDNEISHFPKF